MHNLLSFFIPFIVTTFVQTAHADHEVSKLFGASFVEDEGKRNEAITQYRSHLSVIHANVRTVPWIF